MAIDMPLECFSDVLFLFNQYCVRCNKVKDFNIDFTKWVLDLATIGFLSIAFSQPR